MPTSDEKKPLTWRGEPLTDIETGDRAFRRALALTDRIDLLPDIVTSLEHGRPGPRRALNWRAWFVVNILAVMYSKGDAHMSIAAHILEGLNPSQREELGITGLTPNYSQIESGLETLEGALREHVNKRTGQVHDYQRLRFLNPSDPDRKMTALDIANSVVRAAIPSGIEFTGGVAIDSTDAPTDAARRSSASLSVLNGDGATVPTQDIGDDTVIETIDGKTIRRTIHTRPKTGKTFAFPILGSDGRWQHSHDPDGRDGYRSGKQMGHKEIFLGYDLHIAVDMPLVGAEGIPALARAMNLTRAGSNKAAAGMSLLQAVTDGGHTVTEVAADRGYSMAKHDTWARLLIEEGIDHHHDLGSKEKRRQPGDHPGVIFLDGHPFIANMPQRLQDLSAPSMFASSAKKAASALAYNERWAYAFSTNGPPRENGSQRYRGPALTGKVRCSNNAQSMRQGHHKPMTNCVPGEACACSHTFTVSADDPRAKHRQPELFGTERWLKTYHRRNLVESFNASLKHHHNGLRRHSTRVFGLPKNTILISLIVAVTTINVLIACYGYDEGRPDKLPPAGARILPLLRKRSKKRGANHRHPETPHGKEPPDDPEPEPVAWPKWN